MHIAHRFSKNDVAGVLGLVAFLADKDACMARLTELQAMVDAADAELAKASQASSDALSMKADAEKMNGEAEATKVSLSEKLDAIAAREKVAEQMVADAKAAMAKRGNELSAWENARDAKEADYAKRVAELDAEKATVQNLLDEAAALKADYEQKTANLIAAMTPQGALKAGVGKLEAQVVVRDANGKVKYEGPITMTPQKVRSGNDA